MRGSATRRWPKTTRLVSGTASERTRSAIVTALQKQGFQQNMHGRYLHARKTGVPVHVRLGHTNQDGLQRLLYGVNTSLNAWSHHRGMERLNGSPQYHRCQMFGHSSVVPSAAAMRTRCSEGHQADARGPGSKYVLANCHYRQRQEMSKPFRRKLVKGGSRPHTNRTTPLLYIGGVVGGRGGRGSPIRCDRPRNAPNNDCPEEGPEPGPSTTVLEPPQNWQRQTRRSIPGTEGRLTAWKELGGGRRRRIVRFPPPGSICRPANTPANTSLSGSRPGLRCDEVVTSDTGAANALTAARLPQMIPPVACNTRERHRWAH
ncbi:hypothetical protein EVAR_75134_1 [Eumeta japonica]|uniref:Uncharacterized protein n=1 Tax=Eumeta variegata TaxID=151549 RepID=A0A4C1U0G1_EUMVA|nr:hypothetical protein EVAR_75134_1 [Eumeta japonica]